MFRLHSLLSLITQSITTCSSKSISAIKTCHNFTHTRRCNISIIIPKFCPWVDQLLLSKWMSTLLLLAIQSINLPHLINPTWKKHHLIQIPHQMYVCDTNAIVLTSKPRYQGHQTLSQVLTYVEVQYHPSSFPYFVHELIDHNRVGGRHFSSRWLSCS